MPYPNSPFDSEFDAEILLKLGDEHEPTVTSIQNRELERILEWLCRAPKITCYRVNTLKGDAEMLRKQLQTQIIEVLGDNCLEVEEHPVVRDAIIIKNWGNHPPVLPIHDKEVIVDTTCAAAILRGAHIYAPGVMAMMTNTHTGDCVSIYADASKKCKKGLQTRYDFPKIFLGNGLVRMTRPQLFCQTPPKTGVAVQVTETLSNCPPLGDDFLPKGIALLQNLPSIVCVHVLDPQPGDVILDMCASPGNKTTHISALMQNQGKLVAVDKTPAKIDQLRRRCHDFGAEVEVIQANSTKILNSNSTFSGGSFDRILLDAPCSALGNRPQLANNISAKVLRSYVPLQRKLFHSAVELLKEGGVLIYSTCTITLAENEGMVAWALRTFKCLKLLPSEPLLGGSGLRGSDLSAEQLEKVQRFGPDQDLIGFFIAKFTKCNQ